MGAQSNIVGGRGEDVKDKLHARFFKGRWHDNVRAFPNRTSAMYETRNGASEEEKEGV